MTSFSEKVQRARREQGRNWSLADEQAWLKDHPSDTPLPGYEEAAKAEVEFDPSLIPDLGDDSYERNEEDEDIDRVLDGIGIIDAYNKWANKGTVQSGQRTESIKVRCPDPGHPDNDPSAWINTEKQVWMCGACETGGDKFDIAAWHFGYPVPGYKQGERFPKLRREMAVDLGYTVRRQGHREVVARDPSPRQIEPAPSNVTPLKPEHQPSPEVAPNERLRFRINWKTIVPKDTFLHEWMLATTQDDLPEEYHFWTGLTAVGLIAGNDTHLADYNPVYGNFFTTIIGSTGSGKSRSISHLKRLLAEALPYEEDPANTGVKIVKGVGSGEALIDGFVEMHEDAGVPYTVPVRGVIEFNELSALMGKSSGATSILKPVLMDFYDKDPVIAAGSRTHGNVKAVDAFASCITTTQPRAVRELISRSDMDSGFLNRWVFVYGVEKKRVAYGAREINLDSAAAHARSLKSWAAMRRGSDPMILEGEALEMWEQFFDEIVTPILMPEDGNLEDNPMFGRIALLFKKLILLFAINSRELNPSIESVRRALSLWRYIELSYSKVSGSIASTPMTELEDAIIELIQAATAAGKGGMRRSDIADRFRRSNTREEIKYALASLESLGVIEEVTHRTGSRGPARTVLAVAEAS